MEQPPSHEISNATHVALLLAAGGAMVLQAYLGRLGAKMMDKSLKMLAELREEEKREKPTDQ